VAASGCAVIYYYDGPSIEYKLSFGNHWTDNKYGSYLDQAYPRRLFYDVFGARLETFAHRIGVAGEQERLRDETCVYLVGSPVERYDEATLPRDAISLIARAPGEGAGGLAVYQLHRQPDGSWPPLSQIP
jgi:hypothetical protein